MSTVKVAVSHHEAEVVELRADRELAVEYLKTVIESLDDLEAHAQACWRCASWPRPAVAWARWRVF
jgi:hypothetical protein